MESRQVYLDIRKKNPFMTASSAWRYVKRRLELRNWVRKVGFQWREEKNCCLTASWQQEGFELSAKVVSDDDGWWFFGGEDYGSFSCRWEPGAIHHWRGDRNSCKWFIPSENIVDQEEAHRAYKRAISYGDDWWYVIIVIKACRADIELGKTRTFGIESDFGEDHFTETVFDLTAEVIGLATSALERLCGRPCL